MHAMVLAWTGRALDTARFPCRGRPQGSCLIRVHACGVCRTDLHIVDGELTEPKLPLIIGHEIAGEVAETGAEVDQVQARRPRRGALAGLDLRHLSLFCLQAGRTCATGPASPAITSTGATPSTRWPTSAIASPCRQAYDYAEAAPLLCAGLIGYRSYAWPARP